MAAEPIALRAHAKLTLSLKMTGIRPDGFHLIDAEMISLDLHDVLVFDPNGVGLAVTGKFSDGVPADGSNLVARALGLAGGSAHVTIDKQIPHGGGLGGGSTDAATALAWAGWATDDASLARAAELGADIAFCLVGGRSRVTGIGEILDPLPHVDRSVTLIVPPLRVSTPAVYRAWDDLGGPTVDGPNDLEPAAIAVEPRLEHWRDRIGDRCGRAPTLAGSGATWFVEGEHHNALTDLVDEGAYVALAHAVPSDFAANRAN
ncbi:4-(cytidine 5'-diphospho)-2-C-methyl-D-erythritol kinase [Ilumatobacter sp.]|uniref:4-(cytidine 5'-diphospho)-2-C-methyl-D-erythritol kinase n=1 Tax=Ilumatobacter sp. TaxID=1967498 RepID=UPI0030AA5861